jgi:hypothetical protein
MTFSIAELVTSELYFFLISRSSTKLFSLPQIQIGHFTGEIVNSNKLMLEINLQADGYFSLFFMVKKLCLHKTGLQNNYSLSTQFFF